MSGRRLLVLIVALAGVTTMIFALHVRSVARRGEELRLLREELKATTVQHSVLLVEVREAAEMRADIESKLEKVDSVLDNMNGDIATAHVKREQLDLRIFELNQRQHELLSIDLANQRRRCAEIFAASANEGQKQQELERKLRTAQGAIWVRYAFR